LNAEARAAGKVKEMLNDYEAPSIDPGVDESIREFIDRKKASLPDSNV
jgi:trimethylamine--corrinoid protein Co-methyltransferase